METQTSARKPKDRDFIETPEGFLFCVVGYLHPADKFTAYLKYSPAEQGRWHRQQRAYHRELSFYHAHQVGQTLDDLRQSYPQYVHYCPVRNMEFSMVPRHLVHTYYYPEQRLAQLLARPADALEEETARVVEGIRQVTGISPGEMGVTGSILLNIHDPGFSDIDLVIFGGRNAMRLREALAQAAVAGISSMDEAYADEWCRGVVKHFGLRYDQARWLIQRRWNFVYFGSGQHVVSLHPTRCDEEIEEIYGDHYYRDMGMAHLRATIADARQAVFLPAVYAVEAVEVLQGSKVEVCEIHSYEGLFGQIGEPGDRVVARGKLESIDGGPQHRLVVGSSRREGQEYLLPAGL